MTSIQRMTALVELIRDLENDLVTLAHIERHEGTMPLQTVESRIDKTQGLLRVAHSALVNLCEKKANRMLKSA